MSQSSNNSFDSFSTLEVSGKSYGYFNLSSEKISGLGDICSLPNSIKVLLENLLRHDDGSDNSRKDIEVVANSATNYLRHEIAYYPARVLMQDFTGVPAVVDLAAMRDALVKAGVNPEKINPLSQVDLVIDHSVVIDRFASNSAFAANVDLEMQRNAERYAFLKWGQGAFNNFRLVPPGTGIIHQVNLEYIARAIWTRDQDGQVIAFPDTLVGTDSHTTMINGLGVLGWGVGGIEAEAAMLGQAIPMLIPEVVGFELSGKLEDGITATDLVLRIVQMLREHGVVGKFVEFYGSALDNLPLADRATIANMAPEYGATCGFFPIDRKTIEYLELSGRDKEVTCLVEAYCKAQGMWRESGTPNPVFQSALHLDLGEVRPNLSGPSRPQDRVPMPQLREATEEFITANVEKDQVEATFQSGDDFKMTHGDVVVAAITSCTNTSNPAVMIGAGLVAKKASERGLSRKPWVKTSLAPGSKVVTEYLEKAGLQTYLDEMGFNAVAIGCTTCIGNSGPLPEPVHNTIKDNNLVVSSVLSGNRNFEGRIHPLVKANWLASPPLVVAYALAGTTRINLDSEPIGKDRDGNDVFLRELWPSNDEVTNEIGKIDKSMFIEKYANVFEGDDKWQAIPAGSGTTYSFPPESTYIQLPPFFDKIYTSGKDQNIMGARVLAMLGDSVTTDHISPAGSIAQGSPAAKYLISRGVEPRDFNSYGSRRGNHEVMMRGTFANIRIRNELVPEVEGGYTCLPDSEEVLPIYDAAMYYMERGIPSVVIAGKEYGTGSSRDWAAKGALLLGIKAVIVESYERIHRSNLVGMGVLPLQFMPGEDRKVHKIKGSDTIDILGLDGELTPGQVFEANINRADGSVEKIQLKSRIDTAIEVEYFLSGGVLHYVLNRIRDSVCTEVAG